MPEYISREAALDSICTACEVVLLIDEKETCPYKFTGCEYGSVWSIPAADVVERKVGHWIFHPEQKNIYGGKLIECSECRTQYLVMNVVEEIYCRHCGSKNQNGGQDDV